MNKSLKSSPELMCCRGCLATDVNLFDIHENQLSTAFGCITGLPVLPNDGFPQRLCGVCGILLAKSVAFRDRCQRAQHCLQKQDEDKRTMEYIKTVDRYSHDLVFKLAIAQVEVVDMGTSLEIKEEEELPIVVSETILKDENDPIGLDLAEHSHSPLDDVPKTLDDEKSDEFKEIGKDKDKKTKTFIKKIKIEQVLTTDKVEVKKRQTRKRNVVVKNKKKELKKRRIYGPSPTEYQPNFDVAELEKELNVDIEILDKGSIIDPEARLPSKCKEYEKIPIAQQPESKNEENSVTYAEIRNVTASATLYNNRAIYNLKENDMLSVPSDDEELRNCYYGNKEVSPKRHTGIFKETTILDETINHVNFELEGSRFIKEEIISPLPYDENITGSPNCQLDDQLENNNNATVAETTASVNILVHIKEEVPSAIRDLKNIPEKVNCQSVDNNKTPKKRNRVRDPETRLKISKSKHPMLAACEDKCIRKCAVNITEEHRQEIWNSYWNMDVQGRRDFISRNVESKEIAARSSSSTKRNSTNIYTLLDYRVCKTMFLRTLGYTSDQAVMAVLKANYLNGVSKDEAKVSAAPDLRGRRKPKHAFTDEYFEEIDNFIELFHPTTSHRFQHAPNRRYLPSGLTLTQMFSCLKTHLEQKGMQPCCWSTFHNRIQLKNISTQKSIYKHKKKH